MNSASNNNKTGSYFFKKFTLRSGSNLRLFLGALTLLFAVVLLFACGINNLAHKYSIASAAATPGPRGTGTAPDGTIRYRACQTEVFVLSIPNSQFCCDDDLMYHHDDWVCVAIKDPITKVMSSYHTYWLALVPWAVNVVFDLIRHWRFSAPHALSHRAAWSTFLKPHALRMGFYLVVFVFRLYVLYKGGSWLERFLQRRQRTSQATCWYQSLVRNSRCKDGFDFSDHVCLFYVNYVVPIVMEVCYAYCFSCTPSGGHAPEWSEIEIYEYMQSLKNSPQFLLSQNQDVENIPDEAANATRMNGLQRLHKVRFAAVVVVSSLWLFWCLRSILFTGLYFHTPMENVIGLAVALATVGVSVYFLSWTSWWHRMLRDHETH